MFLRLEEQESSMSLQPSESFVGHTAQTQPTRKPPLSPKKTPVRKIKIVNSQTSPKEPKLTQKAPRSTFHRASQHEQKSEVRSDRIDLFGDRSDRMDMTEAEYNMHLKDRTIAELKLQNSLYEKVFEGMKIGRASLSLKDLKTNQKTEVSARKPFKKVKRPVKQQGKVDRKQSEPLISPKFRINTFDMERNPKQEPQKIDQHRFEKLVRNFSEALSKIGRKQVTQIGKQTKELREIWDTWNRIVKETSNF